MSAYYNENDPFMAAWLGELVKAKAIPDGEIDPRSITDVRAADLRGFTHCHFFAGIGGWAHALDLARWPAEREVWSGSCPCQPFSKAGTKIGAPDPRDLWPTWFELIRERRPCTIFGEQVEHAITYGWLDRLYDDLERENYAIGTLGIPSAYMGAPHIRARLWFVAHTNARGRIFERETRVHANHREPWYDAHRCGADGELVAHTDSTGREEFGRRWYQPARSSEAHFWQAAEWLECTDGKKRPIESGSFPLAHGIPGRVGRLRGYGNAITPQVAAAFIEAYLDGDVAR